MALIDTEFLPTEDYSAKRFRTALLNLAEVQSGVFEAGSFKVTQRAAGANLSVDVAAGSAAIRATNANNSGIYHQTNDATINLVTGAAVGGANPRIDQVVLTVNDATDGGVASNVPEIKIIQGTATSGATLDNRSGAALLPANSLRLADLLMPASGTTYTTANIRDRRPWAKGAYFNAYAAGNVGITTTPISGYLNRVEIGTPASGSNTVVVGFTAAVAPASVGIVIQHGPLVDGVLAKAAGEQSIGAHSGTFQTVNSSVPSVVAPGSHLFSIQLATNTTTATFSQAVLTVDELVQPSAGNN